MLRILTYCLYTILPFFLLFALTLFITQGERLTLDLFISYLDSIVEFVSPLTNFVGRILDFSWLKDATIFDWLKSIYDSILGI